MMANFKGYKKFGCNAHLMEAMETDKDENAPIHQQEEDNSRPLEGPQDVELASQESESEDDHITLKEEEDLPA